jgi:hypothetical protein
LTEEQSRRRYDEAFGAWFQAALEEMPEGVRRSLRRSSRPGAGGEADADGPVERLRSAGWNLAEWRDFPRPGRGPSSRERPRSIRLTTCVQLFAQISQKATNLRDPLYLDTAPARRAADELPRLIEAGDLDGAESLLIDLCRDRDFAAPARATGRRSPRSSAARPPTRRTRSWCCSSISSSATPTPTSRRCCATSSRGASIATGA